MEKTSKPSRSDPVVPMDVNSSSDEETKELTAAALLLASMKYDILDSNTDKALKKLIKANRAKNKSVEACKKKSQLSVPLPLPEGFSNWNLSEHPQIGYGIDGSALPLLPPVANLMDGVIGQCSIPFQKQLTGSDVKDNQCRLMLTADHVKSVILPLLNKGENPSNGIEVTTYDSEGKEYEMVFKNWSSKVHVLTTGWMSFCKEHDLQELTDWVTVWAFRHLGNEKLCFFIVSMRFPINSAVPSRKRAADNVGKAKTKKLKFKAGEEEKEMDLTD